jgi:hypothetical protein
MNDILTDEEIRAVVSSVPARPFREEGGEPTSVRIARAVERAVVEKLAAMGGELPTFDATLREAEGQVRASPLWKRFIDGTPLSNDIAVWMTVFAQHEARTALARGVAAGMAQERERCLAIAAPEHIPFNHEEWRVRCEIRDAIEEQTR